MFSSAPWAFTSVAFAFSLNCAPFASRHDTSRRTITGNRLLRRCSGPDAGLLGLFSAGTPRLLRERHNLLLFYVALQVQIYLLLIFAVPQNSRRYSIFAFNAWNCSGAALIIPEDPRRTSVND